MGNILFYTGISTVIIKHISVVNNAPKSIGSTVTVNNNNILYFVGAGLVVASIPVKLGFSKKIRKAVDILNSDSQKSNISYIESTSLMVNSNGIGLHLSF